jgi:hypothetical protein
MSFAYFYFFSLAVCLIAGWIIQATNESHDYDEFGEAIAFAGFIPVLNLVIACFIAFFVALAIIEFVVRLPSILRRL